MVDRRARTDVVPSLGCKETDHPWDSWTAAWYPLVVWQRESSQATFTRRKEKRRRVTTGNGLADKSQAIVV